MKADLGDRLSGTERAQAHSMALATMALFAGDAGDHWRASIGDRPRHLLTEDQFAELAERAFGPVGVVIGLDLSDSGATLARRTLLHLMRREILRDKDGPDPLIVRAALDRMVFFAGEPDGAEALVDAAAEALGAVSYELNAAGEPIKRLSALAVEQVMLSTVSPPA